MFKINQNPQFTKDVNMAIPALEESEPQKVKVTFQALSDDKLEGFNHTTAEGQKDLLRKVIVNIEGVVEDDGKTPVPFGSVVLESLLGWGHARIKLLRAYTAGIVSAKLGN